MISRKQAGSALIIAIATIVILVLIGVFLFSFSKVLGGARELQNATDSGILNVAKQVLKRPGVGLQQGAETEHFAPLLDNTGKVNLLTYNRMVGEAMLIALNAEAEGTPEAHSNAGQVVDLVQGGDNSIGARLSRELTTQSNITGFFSDMSIGNPLRMLGLATSAKAAEGEFVAGYMKPGSPTNVDLSDAAIPYKVTGSGNLTKLELPVGLLSDRQSSRKNTFMSGYTGIQIPGVNKWISGVPVRPGYAPHLVSAKEMAEKLEPPENCINVPPNTFKEIGQASVSRAAGCAIVGSLTADYTACIPRGYIVFRNGSPSGFTGVLGNDQHIFAQELMAGVYVGPGTGNNRAFTTNGSLYDQWLTFNRNGRVGTRPPTSGIFGNPESINAPPEVITWHDYDDPPSPTATAMLGSFQDTYGKKYMNVPGTSFSNNQLMAIENVKAQVMAGFDKVRFLHDVTDPYYYCNVTAPGQTGLKAFDHGQNYASPPGPVNFGTPGTPAQFFDQCNANAVKNQIVQRVQQIKPGATQAQVMSILGSATLNMGETLYLYMNDGGNLVLSNRAPSWVASGMTPDGPLQTYKNSYDPVFKSVDSYRDAGAPVLPYDRNDPMTAIDGCEYRPSSGYRNLLGEVRFFQEVKFVGGVGGGGGGGQTGRFWDPN